MSELVGDEGIGPDVGERNVNLSDEEIRHFGGCNLKPTSSLDLSGRGTFTRECNTFGERNVNLSDEEIRHFESANLNLGQLKKPLPRPGVEPGMSGNQT